MRVLTMKVAITTATTMVGSKEDVKRVARATATATKRVMATNGNNTRNGYGKEGGGRLTTATMVMGMGTAQKDMTVCATTGERG